MNPVCVCVCWAGQIETVHPFRYSAFVLPTEQVAQLDRTIVRDRYIILYIYYIKYIYHIYYTCVIMLCGFESPSRCENHDRTTVTTRTIPVRSTHARHDLGSEANNGPGLQKDRSPPLSFKTTATFNKFRKLPSPCTASSSIQCETSVTLGRVELVAGHCPAARPSAAKPRSTTRPQPGPRPARGV